MFVLIINPYNFNNFHCEFNKLCALTTSSRVKFNLFAGGALKAVASGDHVETSFFCRQRCSTEFAAFPLIRNIVVFFCKLIISVVKPNITYSWCPHSISCFERERKRYV